jgi:hypothetical protein
MHYIISIALLVAAVIHVIPLSGVLGGKRLEQLYGVALKDPNTEILLRHRAVLFGLLGLLLAAAAYHAELRTLAFCTGLASTISFLIIARMCGGYNAQLSRVVAADIVAIAALLLGGLLHRLSQG